MSQELTLNGSMVYDDGDGASVPLDIADHLVTISALRFQCGKQLISHSAEVAINLGSVTAPGWAIFINRDTVNFIELRVGTGGAKFAKLKPGEFALLRLGSGAQIPYALADTGDCIMEMLLAAT